MAVGPAATTKATTETEGRDLVLRREFDAPPEAVYRAWTEPALLMQWFTPAPWTTPKAQLDVRPGGGNVIVMRSPEGTEYPNRGTYLEVVPNRRLVFTDAYTGDWTPSERAPFMTVILTFEPLENGSRTRYTARVRHWSEADREKHEAMGFHTGWPICAEQLAHLIEESPVISA